MKKLTDFWQFLLQGKKRQFFIFIAIETKNKVHKTSINTNPHTSF